MQHSRFQDWLLLNTICYIFQNFNLISYQNLLLIENVFRIQVINVIRVYCPVSPPPASLLLLSWCPSEILFDWFLSQTPLGWCPSKIKLWASIKLNLRWASTKRSLGEESIKRKLRWVSAKQKLKGGGGKGGHYIQKL